MNKLALFMRESGPARALIPIGLILVIFGIIMFVINNKNKDYIEITSTVFNVELVEEAHTDTEGNDVPASYNIMVKYTVDGKEYEATLNNMSKYDVGDKITIYYNPNDPAQITQTKSIIIPIILVGFGAISLVGGVISGVNAIKKYKKMREQEKGWEIND